MKLSKLLLILAITFSISNCCTSLPYTAKVPILGIPTLPILTPEQNAEIPEETYKVLVAREATLKLHIQNQKELIEVFNKQ